MTFAPFVKPMPAFLHNFIYLDFGADCSGYQVIFITDLCARQGRSCESVDGLNQLIHAHEKEFYSISMTEKGTGNLNDSV